MRTATAAASIAVALLLLGGPRQAWASPRVPTVAIFSGDGSLVASQGRRTVRIWRRVDGKLLHTLDADPMFRGALAAGALALVGESGPEVRRGEGFKQRVKLRAPKVIAYGRAAISADAALAAVPYRADGGAGDNDTVGLFDASTGARLARLGLGKGARILGVTLGRAGRLAAIFGDHPRRGALLRVYRLKGKHRRPRRLLAWSSKAHETTFSAALSPDGKALCLGAGQELLLWRLKAKPARPQPARRPTAAIKALFPPQLRGPGVRLPGAHQLAFSPDGARLASLHALGVVGVATWEVEKLKPVAWNARPTSGGPMRHVIWGQEGKLWVLTAGYSPRVTVHRPEGNRLVKALQLGE